MKIIDEKGRLFKTINVVDLTVVVAVVLAIAAIAYTLFSSPIQNAVAAEVKMTTTIRVRGVTEYVQETLDNIDLTNEQLVSSSAFIDAHIVSVEKAEYENQSFDANGVIQSSVDPVKADYIVTVESSVASNTATPKIDHQEVRVGRGFILKTQEVELNGIITSVVIDD